MGEQIGNKEMETKLEMVITGCRLQYTGKIKFWQVLNLANQSQMHWPIIKLVIFHKTVPIRQN